MSDMQNEEISEGDKNLIMHVSLPIGNDILMGSDVPSVMKSQFKSGNNNYINLILKSL